MEKLAEWFKNSGLSKKYIQRNTGISTSALTKYLRQEVVPNPKTLRKLIDIFNSSGMECDVFEYYQERNDLSFNGCLLHIYCYTNECSINELIEHSNVSLRKISNWMTGKATPNGAEKKDLIEKLGNGIVERIITSENCKSCGVQCICKGYKFCPSCGTEVSEFYQCRACQADIAKDAKFCSACGEPVKAKSKISHPPKVKSKQAPPLSNGITVEFKNSTAMSFEKALSEAQAISGFTKYGSGNNTYYRVNVPTNDLLTLSKLIDALGPMRNKRVFLDGEPNTWDDIFGFVLCHNKKYESYKPHYYCFGFDDEYRLNPWGCLKIDLGFFYEGENWFKWGAWLNDSGDWAFDKARIRHRLQQCLTRCKNCPALDFNHINRVLDAIPNVVNPELNHNWEYLEAWCESDGEEGIVRQVNYYGQMQNVTMVGVKPKGKKAIKQILKDAYAR